MRAIEARGLSKQYGIGGVRSGYDTLRDDLARLARLVASGGRSDVPRGREKVWALKDVSFDIDTGEVVGILGRNGAGKTTLLKVLARITDPTEGYADIRGRVGSLLEVGAGFHRELTGRENTFLNGAILGMSRAEVTARLDEIAEFAGVERFLDTPVKFYSSGMYLRLAFSVAAHLEPDILLVDEVLAVGDAEFQRKCIGKMQDATEEGRTVLFVSHNLAAIRKLCPRSIWIDGGSIALDGATEEVMGAYLKSSFREGDTSILEGKELADRMQIHFAPDPYYVITRLALTDAEGWSKSSFRSDEDIVFTVEYDVRRPVMNLRIIVTLLDEEGRIIVGTENLDQPSSQEHYRYEPGTYTSRCVFPRSTLGEQRFWVDVNMNSGDVQHLRVERGLEFDIVFQPHNENFAPHSGQGYVRPLLEWSTEPGAGSLVPPLPLEDARATGD